MNIAKTIILCNLLAFGSAFTLNAGRINMAALRMSDPVVEAAPAPVPVPPPAPVVPKFNPKEQTGVSGPFGFFDPIGLCPPDEKNFMKYRESELKHGRM